MSTENPDQLPTWDEAAAQHEDTAPSWADAEKKYNPDNYTYPQALIQSSPLAHNPLTQQGREALTDAQRIFVQKQPLWNIVKAFGHGYGETYLDETHEIASDVGQAFNKDYVERTAPVGKALMDGFVVPAARVMATTFMSAPYAGVQEALHQGGKEFVGEQFGRDIAAMPDAFMGEAPNHLPPEVASAKANRVLDGEAVYFGLKEPTQMQAAEIEAATAQFRAGAAEVTAPTIHQVARNVAPETFGKYDELSARRDELRAQVVKAREERNAAIVLPHTEEINDLKAKIEDANPRMAKKYQARIDEMEAEHQKVLEKAERKETPELAALREELQKTDYAMRDLSPEVSKAYREAETRMPPEVPEAQSNVDAQTPEIPQETPDAVSTPETARAETIIKPAEEQRAFIVDDFKKRAIDAGANEAHVSAFAELEAARYETLSQLYPKYTAEEWYTRESANLKAGRNRFSSQARELAQKAKGKIRLATEDAKSTITLFRTSDASTLVHEKGHEWIDQLLRLSDEADAPAAMKADAEAVRKWGGAAEDGVLPTRGHEKFARGFERYMMEGIAPSKALQAVFDKFAQWMTALYQVVDRLKSPINNDIRDVFDRLLAATPEKRVIIKEEPGAMLSEIHTHDAHSTPVSRAAPVGDTVEGEIDLTAKQHSKEVPHVIRRPGNETTDISGAPTRLGGISGESQDLAGGQGIGAQSDQITEGSGNPAGESGRAPSAAGAIPEVEKKAAEVRPESPHGKLPVSETEYVDKAGNIRLDNLNREDQTKDVLRDLAEKNGGFSGIKSGPISDAQRGDMAAALGLDPKNFDPRQPEGVSNSVWAEAVQELTYKALDDASAAGKIFSETGHPEDFASYTAAKQRLLMIADHFSTITAESGRTQRVFDKAHKDFIGNLVGALETENKGRTLNQMQEEARRLSQLETTAQRAKFLQDSKKAKFTDMILEYWINALLSGPMTHVKNMVGNMAVAVNAVVETGGAAVVGKIREAGGNTAERVHGGEAGARLFGIVQGSKDGLRAGAKAFVTEEIGAGAHTIEQANRKNIPGVAGKIIRIPGRLLTAEDELFKAIAYRQELNARAYRIAAEEGLTGDAFNQRVADLTMNPSEEVMKAATKNAEYQTFTKQLGPVGRSIQTFSNSHFLAKLVVPFIRTPVNILKYAGERTPLGVFSKEVQANLLGKNGKIAQDTQIARIGIGTAVSATFMSLAAEGLVTGGGPSDPAEKAMWRLAGNQPYSIRIGDTWYSYAWLDPFATIIGVSADMAEITKAGADNEEDSMQVASALFSSISKNLMSKLSLRGVSDLIQAVTDPDRYGEGYIQNLAGTVVPSFIAQGARTVDPVMRQAHSVIDAMKSRIPGYREGLFPVRDIWGEAIVREGNFGPDLVSPIYEQSISKDPANQTLLKLQIFPAKPDRKIRGIELTDQQYDDYTRIAGRMAKMQLNQLVTIPGFSAVPDFNKIKAINKILQASRERARSLVMMQNPDIVRQATENKLREMQGTKH